jgi:hypothetical protein
MQAQTNCTIRLIHCTRANAFASIERHIRPENSLTRSPPPQAFAG